MTTTHQKFWPLADDPEGEIYETLVWDLPGFRPRRRPKRPVRVPASRKSR